ncbi:hypothetical protein TIFTF001_029356 [Ficus carica]|uniref:Bromodomain associated domain-containing protein n=1 Tax=Ficus carica TaxID=3494 RepID=A0AA88DS89_FICCA|nr:hypothetical protein TIFTF001_029356 [Ficus carica]
MATPPRPTESPSDFCFVVARIAVSQICQSVGFKSIQLSALETLTLVATKHLQAIAKSAAAFAVAANRSDSNLFDLSNALRDLRTTHGISSISSDSNRPDFCLLKSGDLAEIADFVNHAVETPFARPIPWRLDSEKVVVGVEEDSVGRNSAVPRAAHIPNWLPEVPETTKRCGGVSKSGEELWENCLERNGSGGVAVVVVEEEEEEEENGGVEVGKLEMREERESVRFKIGVNLKSGVSKGGKRVCWDKRRNRNRNGNGFKKEGIC